MTAIIIDGKAIAREIEREVESEVRELAGRGIRPALVALRVGSDPASEVYVRSKARKAEQLGLAGSQRHLAASITQAELERELDQLNADGAVDGILLQLPLPSHLDASPLIERIDPKKDVDGFHPQNVGKLHLGRKTLLPCTPAGVIQLLDRSSLPIAGQHVVVVGRSDIVGKPVAALFLARDATVTICHSKTRELGEETRRADILIAAVGRPLLIRAEMVRPGAVVIDVGVNRIEAATAGPEVLADPARAATLQAKGSLLVGDVDFAAVREVAGWITPVPGGVGPMTIAMLMKNTVQAARERRG